MDGRRDGEGIYLCDNLETRTPCMPADQSVPIHVLIKTALA